ncbi:MAG: hypothetical protein A2173_02010 [Planctomycetes bacterium RBG_13_44_8b]|nr:MAG: hypothetical protein A2173_02010 [Planctomycetes bacterium RBG_13_44_8b]
MKLIIKSTRLKYHSFVLIISMVFIAMFGALLAGMAVITGTNVQIASNQHKANSALSAAQSALECGRYIVANTPLPSTSINIVTVEQANNAWNTLCSQVQGQPWVAGQAIQTENEIITPSISFGQANTSFQVKFYRSDVNTIRLEGIGCDGQIERCAGINMKITKDNEVLQYASASRGRMWITGDSTIHGDIYSAWNLSKSQLATLATNPSALATMTAPNISPFNLPSDSEILGTINICWSKGQIEDKTWQLETLDEHGEPMYDENGNKIISPEDEIQGYNEGINYGVPPENMSGMSISDYDTTTYYNTTRAENGGGGDITTSGTTRTEYFPHGINADGTNNYQKSVSGSVTLTRHVYTDQTFDNVRLKASDNALFQNCTFNGVLFVDCSGNVVTGVGTSKYNNIRFDNCTFNSTTVTNTPQTLNWQKNCLYYTGSATFQNETSSEATILAPHFNVNLGNTNPVAGTENVLRGAIVGGIVDVRGNAEVFGTIISMADTSMYTSGYVTNIGATLDDGGSETVAIGDVGVINITPDSDKMLPNGITSPIVIKPLQNTYCENL